MPGIVQSYYLTDDETAFRIRISPEDLAAQPTAPQTPPSKPAQYAKTSRHKGAYGLRPRFITLARQVGTSPDLASKYKRLVILNPSDYQDAVIALTFTVNGVDYNVVGGTKESLK